MIDWIEFLNGIGLNWLHYASLSFYCMSFYPELIFSCCSGNHFHEILCWLLPCVYIHMYVCVCWISNFGTTQLISENSQQQQQLCVFSIFYQFWKKNFFFVMIHNSWRSEHASCLKFSKPFTKCWRSTQEFSATEGIYSFALHSRWISNFSVQRCFWTKCTKCNVFFLLLNHPKTQRILWLWAVLLQQS